MNRSSTPVSVSVGVVVGEGRATASGNGRIAAEVQRSSGDISIGVAPERGVCSGAGVNLPSEQDVLPIIQLAITPVILMSGIGAVLLSMTHRMGRIVDRVRILSGQVRQEKNADEVTHLSQQLATMFRRARLMRFAMTMATMSVFVSGLLVVVIFVSALTRLELSGVVLALFVISVSLLLTGLASFIRDVFLSLRALGSEVDRSLAIAKRNQASGL